MPPPGAVCPAMVRLPEFARMVRSGGLHASAERTGTGVVEIGDFHHDAAASTERRCAATLCARECRNRARRRLSGCGDGDGGRRGLGAVGVACCGDGVRSRRRRSNVSAGRVDRAFRSRPGDGRVGRGALDGGGESLFAAGLNRGGRRRNRDGSDRGESESHGR
jgi:hypothetical protein